MNEKIVRIRPKVVLVNETNSNVVKIGIVKDEPVADIKGKLITAVKKLPSVKKDNKKVVQKPKVVQKVFEEIIIDKDKIEEKKSGSHKSSCGLLVQLLLQSKFTDSEIIKKVLEEYPDRTEKQIQICLCSKRCDINKGEERYKKLHEQAGKILFPLIRNENGELVNKEKTVGTPKKVKKIKPKLELLLNDETDETDETDVNKN